MPAEISTELKSAIQTARPVFHTPGKISRYLKSIGKSVSVNCVRKFMRRDDEEKSGAPPLVRRLADHQRPIVRTKALIRKVKKAAFVPNPPTQVHLAELYKVSRFVIRKILADEKAKRMKKQKHHALTEKQKEKRVAHGKRFLRYLSRRKLRMIVTMDEMMISTEDIDGLTNFYYKQENVVIPDE